MKLGFLKLLIILVCSLSLTLFGLAAGSDRITRNCESVGYFEAKGKFYSCHEITLEKIVTTNIKVLNDD